MPGKPVVGPTIFQLKRSRITARESRIRNDRLPASMARGSRDRPVPIVSIRAPALASLFHHFSSPSSSGDADGLLLGYPPGEGTSGATVTGCFSYGRPMAFYDSLGRVDRRALFGVLSLHHWPRSCTLLGWFRARRRSVPRPSMREHAVSASLAGVLEALAGEFGAAAGSWRAAPVGCIFLLLSSLSDPADDAPDCRAYVMEMGSGGGEAGGSHRAACVDAVDVGPPGFGWLCNTVSPPEARAPHSWSQGLTQQVKPLEDIYIRLMRLRREGEGAVEYVLKQLSTLKVETVESSCITKDYEDALEENQNLLRSMLRTVQGPQQRRYDGLGRTNQQRIGEGIESNLSAPNCSQFSYSELQEATDDFHNSQKIGEGGYGSVYKGFLRHTVVAIKKLDPESMQGLLEFHREVDILTRVRHPNLVTLMGACPSPEPCLVYEFLPNGSLEDRLLRRGGTPPLSWKARARIATEICSALIFLHSHRPHAVVHGDLKPSNILLNADLASKLGDFGICRLLPRTATAAGLRLTEPKGTFPYIDPEFGYTGELAPSSDVYSFGVVLLQLLTGRPALGVVKAVQEAVVSENLQEVLDGSAGEWPYLQAKRLARLGLECCQMSRKSRPRLDKEVWRVLQPMVRASSLETSSAFQKERDGDSHAPSYFLCPILQEIMKDPQVAADGFTYEAVAINGWFDGGHSTSPMTNVPLPHRHLLPNHALRSVIQEWLQQHPEQR